MRYREYDCIVDGNMEQCLEEIEVGDLGEHVYYGPQAEIMEELTRFNTRYSANLEITKTFKWKRGSYERVSELMMRGLGFKRKPSGMYNYLQREDWFRTNTWLTIKDYLRRMDNMLYHLRGTGEVWLDDPSVLVERKNLYNNYLIQKADEAHALIENIDIMQEMYHQLFVHPTSRSSRRYMLVTVLRISPDIMKVYTTNGRTSANPAKHIENIACDTDLYINFISYPLQTMTRHANYDNPSFDVRISGQIEQPEEKGFLSFPYISASRNYQGGYFGGSVCYGDQSTDMNNAIYKYDLPSIVLQSIPWATSYTNETQPHSNIKLMYHGEPAKLSAEYRKIFGTNNADYCNYTPDGEDDYCDRMECTLRYNCEAYKIAHPEPITAEQAEQMTLQWATRMGGVNHAAPTVIHTTDSAGNPISVTRDRTSMEQAADAQEPIQGDREQWNPEEISQTVSDMVEERWPDESPQGDEM